MIPDESSKVSSGKLRYKYSSIEALKKRSNFILKLYPRNTSCCAKR